MKPPNGGPITGPTSAGTVTHAMAWTSALLSLERSSARRPTGVIIAPPMPCRMRAITKWVTDCDSAQPIEPTMNTAIARLNTMRAPNRSAVQPLAGMNTASDNRYEVIASFKVSGLVPISAAIAGSEVAMTVESMFSMNRAVATISGIRRSLFMELQDIPGGRHWPGCSIPEPRRLLRNCANYLNLRGKTAGDPTMIYVLAALVPPLGLLLNGQPFAAIFNLVLIVFCLLFGLVFHVLLLVPSAHALISVHMKREQRMHREVVNAIRRHGPPPGYPR